MPHKTTQKINDGISFLRCSCIVCLWWVSEWVSEYQVPANEPNQSDNDSHSIKKKTII